MENHDCKKCIHARQLSGREWQCRAEKYDIEQFTCFVPMKENKGEKTMEFKDTIEMMTSEDYKERFKAEYYQTKIRYERLKSFNTKIEAAIVTECERNKLPMPLHACPNELLREQQRKMGEYLHILELRAVIEDIEL